MPRGEGSSGSKLGVSSPLTLFVVLFCFAFWLGVLLLVAYLK